MLILKDRIIGVPIMSLQTGTEIARTGQPIIDPRQLMVVAFYCEGPLLTKRPSILHRDDIREMSDVGFIVNNQDELMSPQDLVRLKQVIGFNFTLDGKQVIEQDGRKIGKVVNYTLDSKSFYITQLHVGPSFWQSFGTAEVLIGRQQIIEVSDTKIIVASATVNSPAPAGRTSNPFRRRQPQPEISHTAEN